MKPQNKQTTLMILGVIVAVFLGVVLWLTATKPYEPLVTLNDNGWKTYTNKHLGIQVQYPPGMEIIKTYSGIIEIHGSYGGFNIHYFNSYNDYLKRDVPLEELVARVPKSAIKGNTEIDGVPAVVRTYYLEFHKIIDLFAQKPQDPKILNIDMEPSCTDNGTYDCDRTSSEQKLNEILSTFKFISASGEDRELILSPSWSYGKEERWQSGTTQTIRWAGGDPKSKVKITFYGKTPYSVTVSNTGSYKWNIPVDFEGSSFDIDLGDVILQSPPFVASPILSGSIPVR